MVFTSPPDLRAFGQQILAFVHYEKHSDIFRTEAKKIEIDKALTLEHYTPNKVFVFALIAYRDFACELLC